MENGIVTSLLRIMHYGTLPGAMALLCVITFMAGSRKQGRLLFLTLAASVSLNSLLKAAFRIPRPWLTHPETAPLFAEGGYALPCLHTQITAAVLCALLLTSRKRPVRILCAIGTWAVPAVRVISGVQSLPDTLAALAAGILGSALLCRFRYSSQKPFSARITEGAVLLLCVCSMILCRDPWGPGLFLTFLLLRLPERVFSKADPGRTAFGRFYGTAFGAGIYAVLIIFLPTLAEWLLSPLRAAQTAAIFISTFLPCLLRVFPLF